jgi:hypothetical protein
MRALLPFVACLLAGCASNRYFAPREALNGTGPSGSPSALYELSEGGNNKGEVRIWSDGARRADVGGESTTLVHVGFELENNGNEPLTLAADKLQVDDLRADSVHASGLKPRRWEGDTTAQPGAVAHCAFWFDPGSGVTPRSISAFSVHWQVQSGAKAVFKQVTPFDPFVADYGYYGYGPWGPYYPPYWYGFGYGYGYWGWGWGHHWHH